MADKEPRRRKKRKDGQRKDDIRSEEPSSLSQKSDARDSDQEMEEELVMPVHQPSKVAKLVFIFLFSGLVISMGFVFLSLQGAERGPIDVFDGNHVEEHVEVIQSINEQVPSSDPIDTPYDEGGDVLPTQEDVLTLSPEQVTSEKDLSQPELEISESEDDLDESQNSEPFSSSDLNEDHDEELSDESDEGVLQFEESEEIPITEEVVNEDVPPLEIVTEPPPEEEEEEVAERIQDTDIRDTIEDFDSNDFDSTEEEIEFIPETPVEVSFSESTEFPAVNISDEPLSLSTESSIVDETPSPELFADEKEDFSSYEKSDITNDADYEIRDKLDSIDKVLLKSPEKALKLCDELLPLHQSSPRLHYTKAQALDHLAESQRSNKHLDEAITTYQKVMSVLDTPEKLYILAGNRAANRMQFRGLLGKSLKLLVEMSERLPNNMDVKNQVAVGYLLIGQNSQSKKVLMEVLKLAPESGFAKVHLGFILKTVESNYNESIKLLSEGIASRETGVIDGRFYFHLGDALHRVGRQDEAVKVYEDGVKEGLFLSAYQRSLYNVKNLTGKPWWDPKKSPYSESFKILEKNWKAIRDEALLLMNEKSSGFQPETENLQDKGEWKQFELFARGRKIAKNCIKAGTTCSLIEQIPDAAGCKRGQVKFSIMHPATHVWAHTGPTNCRLRSHLGLVVPDGARIRVANETKQWEEGKVIFFDDSFEHEVWHNGTSFRLVLIVDFWHPELTTHQKTTLTPI